MPGTPGSSRPRFLRVAVGRRERTSQAHWTTALSLLNVVTALIVGFGAAAYSADRSERAARAQTSIGLTRDTLETVQQRLASLYGLYESQPQRQVKCALGVGPEAGLVTSCIFEPKPSTPEFLAKLADLDSSAQVAVVRVKDLDLRSVLFGAIWECAQPRPYWELEGNGLTMGMSIGQYSAGVDSSLDESCSGEFDIANEAVGAAIRAAE